jgi:hypothetical protein
MSAESIFDIIALFRNHLMEDDWHGNNHGSDKLKQA